jgi:integrase
VRRYTDGRGRQRYTIEFEQGGHRVHRRAPPECTHAQARDLETKLRRELFDMNVLGRRPTVLLKDVVQTWLDSKPHKNARDLRNKANQWPEFIRPTTKVDEVVEVAQNAVRAWHALAPATRNRRLAVPKGALTHAYETGVMSENLSPRIKLRRDGENQREIYLTKAHVAKLAKNAPTPEIRKAIWIGSYAGLRAAEVCQLTEASLRNGSISVMGKGRGAGKARLIPVHPFLRPSMRSLPLGLDYWRLQKGFVRARKTAGLPPEVTFHALRHTFASWMINAGVDILTLSKLMGHSSVAVTQRYAHLYTDTLKKAVLKL